MTIRRMYPQEYAQWASSMRLQKNEGCEELEARLQGIPSS